MCVCDKNEQFNFNAFSRPSRNPIDCVFGSLHWRSDEGLVRKEILVSGLTLQGDVPFA